MGDRLANLRQWWLSLKQPQKIIFVAGFVIILIVVSVLGQLMFRPAYEPLFTELESRDAAKIIEHLESSKTPYRLTNEGKNIEVPKNQVYKQRIQMASDGILQNNGVGFELFDEKKFGITENEQHVGYQRALQEELRRTIVQFDGVDQARIHLVLPKQSLFLDEQITPSASIALKLKPTIKLEPNQVAGILSLVLGSVEGLTPENVHIIDMEGNVLNTDAFDQTGDEFSLGSTERFEIQKTFEKELEARVQQLLNRILGPGKAVSMVTAELDFDREETMRVEHGPGSVLSESISGEKGAGSAAGGVPGTDTEMPGDTMPLWDGDAESDYTREQRTTNYEVDTLQQTTIKSPGNVKRLSVSVVVDGEYPQDTLESIQQLVATAVGYDHARGDQIFIQGVEFNNPALVDPEDDPGTAPGLGLNNNQLLIAGLAALVFLIAAVVIILRRRAMRRQEELELLQEEEDARLRAAAAEEKIPGLGLQEQASHREVIKRMAKDNPEEIVDLIKVMLRE